MDNPLYLVAGLGKTGHSIAGYLHRRNQPFVVFDTRKEVPGLAQFKSAFPGVDIFLETLPPTLYKQLSGVVTSPGIALDAPFLKEAFRLNIPVFGDIECLAQEITAPVIAITGTNGKSTVTTLVGEMTRAFGLSVAVAGNIGLPVLNLLDESTSYDLWILELSSFQLDLIFSLKPLAATILNITADHLDRHHSLDAYIQSKQLIYRNANYLLYNREDPQTKPFSQWRQGKLSSFGLTKPRTADWGLIEQEGVSYLAAGEEPFLRVEELGIKGRHNWQNALAACALASCAGVDLKTMKTVLQSFKGLPHRCQWVKTINGVDWINDSKGTNIGATISAISGIGSAMQGKIVLIAGGQGKGANFAELQATVVKYVRYLVLIGEDAQQIAAALAALIPTAQASSFEEAIHFAKQAAQPGDVVLLSPACASFDMFRDFNHRGEVFTQLVNQL